MSQPAPLAFVALLVTPFPPSLGSYWGPDTLSSGRPLSHRLLLLSLSYWPRTGPCRVSVRGRPGAAASSLPPRLLPVLLSLPCPESRLTPHSVVHWPEALQGQVPASVRSSHDGEGASLTIWRVSHRVFSTYRPRAEVPSLLSSPARPARGQLGRQASSQAPTVPPPSRPVPFTHATVR